MLRTKRQRPRTLPKAEDSAPAPVSLPFRLTLSRGHRGWFGQAPEAFIGMLDGHNFGKLIVRIGVD
jgi:hypothetical protein